MTARMSAIDKADSFANGGRIVDAMILLNQLIANDDAEAMFKLATWRMEGRLIPRDLNIAQEMFQKAAKAGHKQAERLYINFLSNGTCGPADWPAACALLVRKMKHDPHYKREIQLLEAMDLDSEGSPVSVPKGELVSEAPNVVLIPSFFSRTECKYLIETGSSYFQRAVVQQGHRQIPDPVRTSYCANFIWPMENPVIHALNRRIASATGTHVHQGEPLELLRYRKGQEYKKHFDFVPGMENQRLVTCLVYLTDGFQGGETCFPSANLKIKPEKGDALIFKNVLDNGERDDMALHAGLPVHRGTKIIATRWIRQFDLVPSS